MLRWLLALLFALLNALPLAGNDGWPKMGLLINTDNAVIWAECEPYDIQQSSERDVMVFLYAPGETIGWACAQAVSQPIQ